MLVRASRRVQKLYGLLEPVQCVLAADESSSSQQASTSGRSNLDWQWQPLRHLRKSAQQVRNGDVVMRDDSIARVSSFFWHHGKARAGGYISCDLIDLKTGTKTNVRLKNDEQVETAELESLPFQVLYKEEGKNNEGLVHLMNPDTFEQVSVPLDVFGDARRWLLPEMMVDLKFLKDEEQPVTGTIPVKVQRKVVEARTTQPKADGTTNRHVVVEGDSGSIVVPGHIQEGDVIVINTATATYDSKA